MFPAPVYAKKRKWESHEANLPANVPVHTLDNEGDVFLHVGEKVGTETGEGQECVFRVCSRALVRHSYGFRSILHGSYETIESQTGKSKWIVSLPGDMPTPMGHMLELMHGNTASFIGAEVTTRPDAVRTASLLVVANKYSCMRLLGPFLPQWVRDYEAYAKSFDGLKPSKESSIRLLHTACILAQLGAGDAYVQAMTRLVRTLSSDWNGRVPASIASIAPESLQDFVSKASHVTKKNILELMKRDIDLLSSNYPINPSAKAANIVHRCDTPSERAWCAMASLEYLRSKLKRAGLWPLHLCLETKVNPQELHQTICDMAAQNPNQQCNRHKWSSSNVSLAEWQNPGLRVVKYKYEYEASESEKAHMRRRLSVLGASSL
ncbi:hypothetical protein Micbo1qcDRAFT_170314 [Microdochium bolleyi]|uniref:BTB domain-containing protein n=1 Tax=Microdochium bolleyi TaxID=196109 RepID=A0A136JH55_9PEZI|nr:hypothetical protein Micbo1qcDRAFT_170314 [Microdochium bolleyi]